VGPAGVLFAGTRITCRTLCGAGRCIVCWYSYYLPYIVWGRQVYCLLVLSYFVSLSGKDFLAVEQLIGVKICMLVSQHLPCVFLHFEGQTLRCLRIPDPKRRSCWNFGLSITNLTMIISKMVSCSSRVLIVNTDSRWSFPKM